MKFLLILATLLTYATSGFSSDGDMTVDMPDDSVSSDSDAISELPSDDTSMDITAPEERSDLSDDDIGL